MLVKTRNPHETKLPSVIQVPYSSMFVKITAVHMHITFASKVFFLNLEVQNLGAH